MRKTDCLVARAYLSAFRERGGLLAFLFHSLFHDEREIALNQVDPLQRTTVAQFRAFIAYYQKHGYRFVNPDELDALEPGGKYALVTFDDGYFNNVLALPVLEEYQVPALFFISTDHVRERKSFWWDVLYRERVAQGATPDQVYHEAQALKSLTTEQIEAELVARFGADALKPRGDIDRPFTPDELRAFARHPLVHLGNHTANHAILTNYSAEDAHAQILRAQEALEEMTGARPRTIAFPNGARSGPVVQTCAELGLRVGFTIRPAKNALPAGQSCSGLNVSRRTPSDLPFVRGGADHHSPPYEGRGGGGETTHSVASKAPYGKPERPWTAGSGLVQVDRFSLHDELPVEAQCRAYRSDLLLYGLFRAGYLKLARGWANAST
ncbi:MAG: polysaccharide deacetylase family protein [Isosphaeraceae bacterium]|nr:polysaccharide deacetylase family protein [Isosphaeraceae bacterium]